MHWQLHNVGNSFANSYLENHIVNITDIKESNLILMLQYFSVD